MLQLYLNSTSFGRDSGIYFTLSFISSVVITGYKDWLQWPSVELFPYHQRFYAAAQFRNSKTFRSGRGGAARGAGAVPLTLLLPPCSQGHGAAVPESHHRPLPHEDLRRGPAGQGPGQPVLRRGRLGRGPRVQVSGVRCPSLGRGVHPGRRVSCPWLCCGLTAPSRLPKG